MEDEIRTGRWRELAQHLLAQQEVPAPFPEFTGGMNLIAAPVATPPRSKTDARWSLARQKEIELMFAVGMPIPEPTDIQYAIDDLIYKLNEAREKLHLLGGWLDDEEPA